VKTPDGSEQGDDKAEEENKKIFLLDEELEWEIIDLRRCSIKIYLLPQLIFSIHVSFLPALETLNLTFN
jgi:hypothetical protein